MSYKVFEKAIEAENILFDTRTELYVVPDKNSKEALSSEDKSVILGLRFTVNGEAVGGPAVISKADIRELSVEEIETLSPRGNSL